MSSSCLNIVKGGEPMSIMYNILKCNVKIQILVKNKKIVGK